MVGSSNGRLYYKISNWYEIIDFLPFAKKITPMWEESLGLKNSIEHKHEASFRLHARVAKNFLKELRNSQKNMAWLNQKFIEVENAYRESYSDELNLEQSIDLFYQLADNLFPHWDLTLINDMYCFMFTYLAGARNKAALADIRNLESMKPVRAIKALAELCRETGVESERYQTAKSEFIREYGDRCLGELKLETHTYRTHPALVDEFVRGRLKKPPKPKKAESEAPSKDRFLVRHAKLGIYNRERSRMNRTRLFGMARTIFCTVGEELQREGYLDDAEDVFYLTIPELESGSFVRCRALIEERKAEYAMFASLPPYSRLIFDGEIRNKRVQNAKFDLLHKSDVLTGVSSSLGTVTGEAVVITEPNLSIDTHDKILVTRSTDPGWVFLIENAKGIIAEKGSLLSHTAIITRELHKPSMVNVRDATKRIRTGDIVELDAVSGVIRILQET